MKILSILFAHLIVRVWPLAILTSLLITWCIWQYSPDGQSGIWGTAFPLWLVSSGLYFYARWWFLRLIIGSYGERADAMMESSSEIVNANRAENRELIRYMFSFVDASGQKHKKSFLEIRYSPRPAQSSAMPTYPKEKFVRYPKLGEKFEVLYLKGLEKHPMILNTGESEFVRSIQEDGKQDFIQQLSDRVSKAKILADADPHNPERQKLYQQAQQDLHNYQQFGTEPMLTEKVSGELDFKSNP
ncbi:hypothetical protein V9W64_05005 [Neisseria leonii]|uniref:Uncharacterized protein n=1 Tax=Neisseria leonii TaxID=2995413 RepID=A0A9X4IEZ8_9NEIS|nr:hypothetical protein [Neisseria sp. 51.81]MDD9328648.1 hypothetical protein [Neisseria sp. 51.81]